MGSALRFRLAAALVTLALATACTGDGPSRDPTPGQGPPAASYSTSLDLARAVHRAVVLRDGRVLLTGGCSTAGCEGVDAAARSALFDPRSGLFSDGPAMAEPRVSHTATLLPDGRVLVIGGYPAEGAAPTGSMEIYDPQRNRFLRFGSLQVPRADHTATLLPNGLVLVAGGRGADGRALDSVELVDPRTGDVQPAPPLPGPRTAHTATEIPGGVLLIGGTGTGAVAMRSTVEYVTAAGRWRSGPDLLRARVKHAAAALPDGRVLVVGGAPSVESRHRFADTELVDPVAARSVPGPRLTDGRYKIGDAVAVLPDGRVAIAGGRTVEVFDPRTGLIRTVPGSGLGRRRSFQTATALSDTQVLVAGGYDSSIRPTRMSWLIQLG
jgi:hypothetical protein